MSEITEEQAEEGSFFLDDEDLTNRIRRIVEYQKSRYCSSSSSSLSAASSSSSFSSSSKNNSLLDLMKTGSTSLRRLFDMEHTSLATHFEEYSGSPLIKPIPLYISDGDDQVPDSWAVIRQSGRTWGVHLSSDEEDIAMEGKFKIQNNKRVKAKKRKLKRIKSFRRLPGFGFRLCNGYRFRLRLRRLRILICGRKF